MKIHRTDLEYLDYIRGNVDALVKRAAEQYDSPKIKVLEIGPAEYSLGRKYFKRATVRTLDIDPDRKPDYLADISTRYWALTVRETFDVVICTEVLEHTANPFYAIEGIQRIFEWKKGVLILSTPFNFRIHGMGGYDPYKQGLDLPPDYWRFTESGLRLLLKDFHIKEFKELSSDRPLCPIQYTVICEKR